MKKLLLLGLLALRAACTHAATNDLVITSITRQDDCTTLQWKSHPGQFFTVYWTDRLKPPIFWRVAEVNVPSGGTNTTWYECEGGEEMMMAGGGQTNSTSAKPALTPEELAVRLEASRARAKETIEYLMKQLQEAMERAAKWHEDYKAGRITLSTNDPGSMEWFSAVFDGAVG